VIDTQPVSGRRANARAIDNAESGTARRRINQFSYPSSMGLGRPTTRTPASARNRR
jgi:hypothetical protein